MRRIVIACGILAGIILGLFALLVNPFAPRLSAGADSGQPLEFVYAPAEFRGFELTPLALLGLAGSGGGFEEPAIRYARVDVATLISPGRPEPALGVRISAIARQNSILRGQLGVATGWNIAWPGQGSIFLAGSENFWNVTRDSLWSMLRGHGFSPAGNVYVLPPIAGSGTGQAALGARGALAGTAGSFSETFDPPSGRGSDLGGRRIIRISPKR